MNADVRQNMLNEANQRMSGIRRGCGCLIAILVGGGVGTVAFSIVNAITKDFVASSIACVVSGMLTGALWDKLWDK